MCKRNEHEDFVAGLVDDLLHHVQPIAYVELDHLMGIRVHRTAVVHDEVFPIYSTYNKTIPRAAIYKVVDCDLPGVVSACISGHL